jgi:hypothetical protein
MRGIDQSCAHFLRFVAQGAFLSPRDALATHLLCEEIVHAIEGRQVPLSSATTS